MFPFFRFPVLIFSFFLLTHDRPRHTPDFRRIVFIDTAHRVVPNPGNPEPVISVPVIAEYCPITIDYCDFSYHTGRLYHHHSLLSTGRYQSNIFPINVFVLRGLMIFDLNFQKWTRNKIMSKNRTKPFIVRL
jgi:hypothetical protein